GRGRFDRTPERFGGGRRRRSTFIGAQHLQTVGYAAATDLADQYPHASLAVIDDAGHALPHEQPELLRALVAEWLARRALVPARGRLAQVSMVAGVSPVRWTTA
ncbi:MAG TPA: hypothetical protein VIG96_01745, partial [Blastococcus sp.]